MESHTTARIVFKLSPTITCVKINRTVILEQRDPNTDILSKYLFIKEEPGQWVAVEFLFK